MAARPSFSRLVIFNLLIIFGILALAEIGLRIAGNEPGLIAERAPFRNDNADLEVYKDYTADEYGITKLSDDARQFVRNGIATGTEDEDDNFILVDMLIPDFIALNKGELRNDFSKFIQGIKQKPDAARTDVEQAYLDYTKSPINADGFRSIPFIAYNADQPKVLLLGDSHTYGAEATNITSSFADNLAAKGYVVYNSGIVATDPAQYLAVAKHWIPILKPDIVSVAFCLNNDIMYVQREPKPNQKMFYATNVENIMACPDGEYFTTAQSAYDFVRSECYIPDQRLKPLNWLLAKTVLTTKVWMLLRKIGVIKPSETKQDYNERVSRFRSDVPVSEVYLKEIKTIAEANGAAFVLTGIPDGDDLDKRLKDVPGLINELTMYIPEETGPQDRAEGGHFNDQGYKKYTEFLSGIIDSVLDQNNSY